MKIYVDELPKNCDDCPCHNGESGYCQITGKYVCEYVPKSCPLQSLAEHDKQVRAKVVAEIKQKAVHSHFGYMGKTEKGYYYIYAGILEDIEQKELKNENAEFSKMIESLKQRLVEKDARIEELEGQFAYECECNKQFAECQKENEELKQQLKDLQEKEKVFSRKFAIEQLKEIKKLFQKKYSYNVPECDFAVIYEDDIDEIIDSQIKQLKGE